MHYVLKLTSYKLIGNSFEIKRSRKRFESTVLKCGIFHNVKHDDLYRSADPVRAMKCRTLR
jgi:hypothetical protein